MFPATSVSVVSYTELIGHVPRRIACREHTHQRQSRDAHRNTLNNAFVIIAGRSAHLQTALQMPDQLGRHVAATLYVTYANTGTVAMPAPLLELSDPNPLQRPLLTLDSTQNHAGTLHQCLARRLQQYHYHSRQRRNSRRASPWRNHQCTGLLRGHAAALRLRRSERSHDARCASKPRIPIRSIGAHSNRSYSLPMFPRPPGIASMRT